MAVRVEGKVAFITGAARGQGRSHAVRLAEEGADIIAVDICERLPCVRYDPATPEDLEETARLVEEKGQRVIAKQADVRDRAALKKIVDDGVAELGHLDIVIPAAGIGAYDAVDQISEQTWQEVIDVNLTGAWHSCVVSLPHLQANGGGSIILTSSGAVPRTSANLGHYTASKHGVIGLMRTLAKEQAEYNIRANAISPTLVNTPMVMSDDTYRLFRPELESPTADDIVETAKTMNMLPVAWLEPVDVSNGVLFLASDESRYVTGSEMRIDAGYGAN